MKFHNCHHTTVYDAKEILNFANRLGETCAIIDRNPNLEGLVDIHRCVYLPSAYEKNPKTQTENSSQVRKVRLQKIRAVNLT